MPGLSVRLPIVPDKVPPDRPARKLNVLLALRRACNAVALPASVTPLAKCGGKPVLELAPVQVVPTGVEQTPRFQLMVVEPVFVTVELPRTAKFPRAGMLFSPTGPA